MVLAKKIAETEWCKEVIPLKNKQYWGVCCGPEIVKVYTNYDKALEESVMWTMETGAQHTVEPLIKRKNKEETK